MKNIFQFIKDEEGASMAEYALLIGLIAVALATVISAFRTSMQSSFTRASDTLNSQQ